MGELEAFLRQRQAELGDAGDGRRLQLAELRAKIQAQLAASHDFKGLNQEEARSLAREQAWGLVQGAADGEFRSMVLSQEEKAETVRRIEAGMFGLGPLQELIDDPAVTEVMVNGPRRIFVERRMEGHRSQVMPAMDRFGTPLEFTNDAELLTTIERIVAPINRKVDESTPIVDARLKENGASVNIVLHPISLDGHAITIRTFPEPITMDKLVAINSVPQWLADLLQQMVSARYNLVVSGGTGSGKTTFLNALSQFIPAHERVVTVEDAAELQLRQAATLSAWNHGPPTSKVRGPSRFGTW